jgi:hypothetical protein
MSNSFIHALSFMHKAGDANLGSCDKAKTTAALLDLIENNPITSF